jgi:BirA family transcriptional regulator, biotin operon repressor / biotin---[acetyl-CoA-carboxylase] ligase
MSNGGSAHELSAEVLRSAVNTRRVGRQVVVLPEVDSTNTYALEQMAGPHGVEADGWVVFAEYQTAGRGRHGRGWHAPRGASLLFTVLLCSKGDIPEPTRLIMAASVAVADGVARAAGVDATIRWPNDIQVAGRKLAGILVEVRPLPSDAWVTAIGIGVNCLQHVGHFPPELRDRATSLELVSPFAVDRQAVAVSILRRLDEYFAEENSFGGEGNAELDARLAEEWRARSGDIGERVILESVGETYTGRILDVQPRSGLLVHLDTGARRQFDPATTTRV